MPAFVEAATPRLVKLRPWYITLPEATFRCPAMTSPEFLLAVAINASDTEDFTLSQLQAKRCGGRLHLVPPCRDILQVEDNFTHGGSIAFRLHHRFRAAKHLLHDAPAHAFESRHAGHPGRGRPRCARPAARRRDH